MYGLVDEMNQPIAFHREKRVILKYMKGYEKTNNEMLRPIHIKNKKVKNYYHYEDLYLVRYGETYIQSKYLYVRQLDLEPLLHDLECAHDVIIRIIEFNNNEKECSKLSKALDIIDTETERLKNEIPSTSDLESRKIDYDMYQYKVSDYGK